MAASPQVGWRALSHVTYLRNLALLVLLGTIAAALADYIFKVRAVETFGNGDKLLRFFAIYYAATSLLAFVIQATSSSVASGMLLHRKKESRDASSTSLTR